MSRTRCSVQRCGAEPGPSSRAPYRCMGPGSAAHRASARCAASGARVVSVSLSPRRHCEEHATKLRSNLALMRRSNPDCHHGNILDCFRLRRTSRCARNDGVGGTGLLFPSAPSSQTRLPVLATHSPELCCSFAPSKDQKAQGRPGAGGTRRSVHKENAHGGGSQVCRPPGLPCADGFNGVLRALLGERCTIAPVTSPPIDAHAGWLPHHGEV